jgi:hypothetical protein
MPDPRELSAERIRLAAQACDAIDDQIKLAADLMHSNSKNNFGVFVDPGMVHMRLADASRRLTEAVKMIELTQWPRQEDYRT